MNRLICEKVDQALEIMRVRNIECWVIFTQEMGKECDPVYPLLMGNLDLAAGALVYCIIDIYSNIHFRQCSAVAIVG